MGYTPAGIDQEAVPAGTDREEVPVATVPGAGDDILVQGMVVPICTAQQR